MASINKEIVLEDGTKETLVISGDDNTRVNLGSNYVLANGKRESSFTKKFRGTIFGSEIGFRSKGFSSIAILATVIAILTVLILVFIWKY